MNGATRKKVVIRPQPPQPSLASDARKPLRWTDPGIVWKPAPMGDLGALWRTKR